MGIFAPITRTFLSLKDNMPGMLPSPSFTLTPLGAAILPTYFKIHRR